MKYSFSPLFAPQLPPHILEQTDFVPVTILTITIPTTGISITTIYTITIPTINPNTHSLPHHPTYILSTTSPHIPTTPSPSTQNTLTLHPQQPHPPPTTPSRTYLTPCPRKATYKVYSDRSNVLHQPSSPSHYQQRDRPMFVNKTRMASETFARVAVHPLRSQCRVNLTSKHVSKLTKFGIRNIR